MSGLPAADDFALAGGAALIVHGLVDRSTRDLDYFATASDAVAGVVPALEAALRRDPDTQHADELRAWFEQWQREITRSLQHPGRGR